MTHTAQTPHIIARDEDIIAVCKPAGYLTHPAGGNEAPDIGTWLDAQEGLRGVRPAHRLDLQVSGLLLCARTPAQRARISACLAEPETQKPYLALVHGVTRKKGAIRRNLKDARRKKSLTALTNYRRLEVLRERFSLLKVLITTGRKHQIRRHLEGIGHPVVGDRRYRGRRRKALRGTPDRIWLHAERIQFSDGRSWTAPLPPDLQAHLTSLQPTDAEAPAAPLKP